MADETSFETADLWNAFRYFLGRWTGTGSGKTGLSQVKREYRFVLNEQFIQVANTSVYEPQEANPQGEVHEDIGYFGYDRNRQKYVFREFHVEGYVIQYLLEQLDPGGQKLVLTSEVIENIPAGWQARTTYEILGEDTFIETFDLAGPEQEWICYIVNELTREPRD
jgi:hypothetical protein